MVSIKIPIKDSNAHFLLCTICKEEKGRSRKFHSLHALRWHFKHEHKTQLIGSQINFSKTDDTS